MARGRLISRSLGSSRKFHELLSKGGKLGEFCQILFPLVIANTDDFGRMPGDAFTVKNLVLPSSRRPEADFEQALRVMQHVGLIVRYDVGRSTYLQVERFDEHQPNLHKRGASRFPAPPMQENAVVSLDASEADVEEWIAADLQAGRLRVGAFTVTDVRRQVRKGSSYLDIVATTAEGPVIVVEVKRQRVTLTALGQVRGYRELLDGDVIAVLIGHGLAENLELPVTDVLIGTYGDDCVIQTANQAFDLTLNHVRAPLNHVPKTLNHIPSELNPEPRTQNPEVNPQPRTALTRTADVLFEQFWSAYPKKKSKDDARKEWDKRRPDADLLAIMLAALEIQRGSRDWVKDNGQFVPYPAKWLRHAGWTDVVDVDVSDAQTRGYDAWECPHPPPTCDNRSRCQQRTEMDAYRARQAV